MSPQHHSGIPVHTIANLGLGGGGGGGGGGVANGQPLVPAQPGAVGIGGGAGAGAGAGANGQHLVAATGDVVQHIHHGPTQHITNNNITNNGVDNDTLRLFLGLADDKGEAKAVAAAKAAEAEAAKAEAEAAKAAANDLVENTLRDLFLKNQAFISKTHDESRRFHQKDHEESNRKVRLLMSFFFFRQTVAHIFSPPNEIFYSQLLTAETVGVGESGDAFASAE
jgi:hypothetical protein